MESPLVASDIFNSFQIWRCKMLEMAVDEVVSSVLAAVELLWVPGGSKESVASLQAPKRDLCNFWAF